MGERLIHVRCIDRPGAGLDLAHGFTMNPGDEAYLPATDAILWWLWNCAELLEPLKLDDLPQVWKHLPKSSRYELHYNRLVDYIYRGVNLAARGDGRSRQTLRAMEREAKLYRSLIEGGSVHGIDSGMRIVHRILQDISKEVSAKQNQ